MYFLDICIFIATRLSMSYFSLSELWFIFFDSAQLAELGFFNLVSQISFSFP